ncbi:MAG: hypothetical protein K0U24_02965 [Gammaproteobacteria bacterium]|nr:hypothetical protein [Gammaproteobacteria bacterium]
MFVLPRIGNDSPLVLFNPYITYSDENGIEDACSEALIKYPKRFKQYNKVSIMPIYGTICVYDPLLHAFTVLNLKTMLDEQLQKETMKGYFLALLEKQLPQLISPQWDFAWVHSRTFSLWGVDWDFHVYPSSAYFKASIKRVFLIFCLVTLGFLGGFVWVLLRARNAKAEINSDYMVHLK